MDYTKTNTEKPKSEISFLFFRIVCRPYSD